MQAIRATKPWDISIYLIDRILVKIFGFSESWSSFKNLKFIKLIHILNRPSNTKFCFYEPVFQALKFWDNSSDFGYWSFRENFVFLEETFRALKNPNISRCVIDWIGSQKVWASQASYPSYWTLRFSKLLHRRNWFAKIWAFWASYLSYGKSN